MFSRLEHKLIYEEVIEMIIERIRSGSLAVGQKLPPERVLAEEMLVSRTSLREALNELKRQGYIYSIYGSGNYIDAEAAEELMPPLSIKINNDRKLAQDIISVRLYIEGHMAALAAQYASEEDKDKIYDTIKAMKEDIKAGYTGIEGDYQFHIEVARASQNQAFTLIVELIHDILVESQKATLSIPGQPELSVKDHLAIYKAIKQGDADTASRAMTEHLEKAYRNLDEFRAREAKKKK
jgi:GntR family transcriptional repressor for pyruvate dehydrogenase complex